MLSDASASQMLEIIIGEIPEQGLGARIHASMDGVVKSVDGAVVIGK